ncbi:MAG TPA: polyprenyl synthetase family protein [Actinomycetota bacterium]
MKPLPLPPACEDIARSVDAELDAFLDEQRAETEARAPGVGRLFDELARIVASGGKRLRPVFCCLGHAAAGGEIDRPILRAAASLELLHTFAIVHDDVMDHSRVRRGSPATWVQLADDHRREGFPGDPDAFGLSGAVLEGDLALMLADRGLLESGFPTDRLLPAIARYDRMRTEVVAGQFLDVLAAHRGRLTEGEARRVATLKSGGYTVEGPLHIGALLGDGPAALLDALSRYGVPLGEAFQLRDDLLGVFGDPEVTGKDRDSDLREGKRTLLAARALAAASGEDRRLLEDRFGHPGLVPDELDRMRAIIEATGARASTQALVDELAARARVALEEPAIPREVAALLDGLVDTVALRVS